MRCLRVLFLGAGLFLSPALAWAADPHGTADEELGDHAVGHHGLDVKALALQLLNFAVLATILGYFGGKAINRALALRHEQLKLDLDEALRVRKAAEARLKENERRLANLESEIAALQASIRNEARLEERRLVETAQEKARRIQEETKFLVDQQVKEAEIRFRAEMAEEAVRIAEDIVKRSLGPDDEVRLQRTFIEDVEREASASPRT